MPVSEVVYQYGGQGIETGSFSAVLGEHFHKQQ